MFGMALIFLYQHDQFLAELATIAMKVYIKHHVHLDHTLCLVQLELQPAQSFLLAMVISQLIIHQFYVLQVIIQMSQEAIALFVHKDLVVLVVQVDIKNQQDAALASMLL